MADRAPVIFVLLLLQASFGLIATLGLLLLTGGNPLYLVVPLVVAVTQFVLAGFVARDRRWAYGVVLGFEWLLIVGFAVNSAVGVLPWVDLTVNLMSLLTRAALPAAVLWLCIGRLA